MWLPALAVFQSCCSSVLLRYSYTLQCNIETAFCFPFVFMDRRMVKERGFQQPWIQPLLLCVHLHPTAKLVLLFSHGACGSSWGDMDDVTFAHLVSDYLSFRILWSSWSPSTGFLLPEHVPTCFFPPLFFFHFFYQDNKYT